MKLTNAALRGLIKKPGWHGDDGNLFFRVLPGEKGYWVYRYQGADKRRHAMSLGPYPEVSLDKARDRRDAARAKLKTDKIDPLADRRAGERARTAVPAFGQAADDYIAAHEASWKTDKYRAQWKMTLTTYCAPIRDMAVDQINTEAVLRVLQPVWTRAPQTASLLRGRIETVLNAARALGHIDSDRANPARWRGHLDHLLPSPMKIGKRGHHPAMPYADAPAFMTELKAMNGRGGVPAKALAMIILCAARPSEVLGAPWEEIPFAPAVNLWTIPAERMKMEVEHIVPLSDAALDLVREQLAARRPNQTLVFPGERPRRPVSATTLKKIMRRLGAGAYTVHGFRSTFRNWAADHGVEFEVGEQCLAHAVGNAVTRAYLRTTMLERRRKVMADWAAFLTGESVGATVVPLRQAQGGLFNGKQLKGSGLDV